MRYLLQRAKKPGLLAASFVLVLSLAILTLLPAPPTPIANTPFEQTIFEARVLEVLSEEETFQEVLGRSTIEQELHVTVELPEQSTETVVLNDLFPVKPGQTIYVQEGFFAEEGQSFDVVNIKRTGGLLWLLLLFIALALLVGGKKGFSALASLAFSIAIIFRFIVPQILYGADPILIGVAGGFFILVVSLWLSYGVSITSLSALTGITCSLLVVGIIGRASIAALSFTGFGGEASFYLNLQAGNLNLLGLLLAGIIIAAIGVLDDVAVTQASTVLALSKTDNTLKGFPLFKRAMVVGKDHIAAVINTLVLAYAGASLPILLLLSLEQFPLNLSLSSEFIAEEVLRTLVSSLGLILAVPLTTLIAVFVLSLNPKTSFLKKT